MISFSLSDKDYMFRLKIWGIISKHEGWFRLNNKSAYLEAMHSTFLHCLRKADRDASDSKLDSYVRELAKNILRDNNKSVLFSDLFPDDVEGEISNAEDILLSDKTEDVADRSEVYMDDVIREVEKLFLLYPKEMALLGKSAVDLDSVSITNASFRESLGNLYRGYGAKAVVSGIRFVYDANGKKVLDVESNVKQIRLKNICIEDVDVYISDKPVEVGGKEYYINTEDLLTGFNVDFADEWTSGFKDIYVVGIYNYMDFICNEAYVSGVSSRLYNCCGNTHLFTSVAGVHQFNIMADDFVEYCRIELICNILDHFSTTLVASTPDRIYVTGGKLKNYSAIKVSLDKEKSILLEIKPLSK